MYITAALQLYIFITFLQFNYSVRTQAQLPCAHIVLFLLKKQPTFHAKAVNTTPTGIAARIATITIRYYY